MFLVPEGAQTLLSRDRLRTTLLREGNLAPPTQSRILKFAVFEVDLEGGELRKSGLRQKLTGQPFEVLRLLLEHPQQIVTRGELQQRIWPNDTFVDYDLALRKAVARLREALGDSAETPRFIETIPRHGYRFIAPLTGTAEVGAVRELSPAAGRLSHAIRTALVLVASGLALLGAVAGVMRSGNTTAPQIRSIAVLPLENLSGDPSQEYFSEGMTDALITDLAQIAGVKVISRTSSMQYKQTRKPLPEIAHELNVDGIVEGSVQRSGDRVFITVQLIHGPSDKHLWANSYERQVRDVFALERDVTEDVAREVRARLTTGNEGSRSQPRPVTPEALEAYLQGNYFLNRYGKGSGDEEKTKAREYFQRAIDADPDFAPAYDGLANSHFGVLWPSKQDAEFIQKAEEKAVGLDPNFSDARVHLASIKWSQWDFRGAEEELQQALALNPNSAKAHEALGYLTAVLGRPDEGLRECQIAQQLDPAGNHLPPALYHAGKYDRAIALAQTMLHADPNNGYLHDSLYSYYATKGMYKEASQELEKVLMLFGYPHAAARVHKALVIRGGRNGIRQFAVELERLMAAKRVYAPGHLAEAYAILGDKDRAFYWLGESYKDHDIAWTTTDHPLEDLEVNHVLDSLRSDRRYRDLVRRVGLPVVPVGYPGASSQDTSRN